MHFGDDKKYIPIGYRQYLQLCEAISVDTGFIDKYFKNYEEFLDYMNICPVVKLDIKNSSSKWEFCTTEKLIEVVKIILDGRNPNQLTKDEMKRLIVSVYSNTRCKMLQIASVLHVDYKFVKDCIKGKGAPQPE